MSTKLSSLNKVHQEKTLQADIFVKIVQGTERTAGRIPYCSYLCVCVRERKIAGMCMLVRLRVCARISMSRVCVCVYMCVCLCVCVSERVYICKLVRGLY